MLAIILAICVGFNKGMDFKGGIIVSVMAEEQNLEEEKEYSTFKYRLDEVLEENGVKGSIYLLEKDSVSYNDVLNHEQHVLLHAIYNSRLVIHLLFL